MRKRRGVAIVAIVVLLILIDLIVIGLVVTGAREHDLTRRRLATVRAFYAAEAGMNMAIRELMENADEDADGGIGTISDNGDDADDPDLGAARVVVTASTTGDRTTLTGRGRSGAARRRLQAVLE